MRKSCVKSLVGVLVIMSLFLLTSCVKDSEIKAVERKYDIKLPKDTRVDFFIQSDESFHGDYVKYYVFSFQSEPVKLLNEFKSRNLKQDEEENLFEELKKYYEMALDPISDKPIKNKIPEKYLPDWGIEYEWNFGDALNGMAAIYSSETMRMMICNWNR